MLERDGQHMGVVTKALEKKVPPSSMMRRVLFIACMDPEQTGVKSGVSLKRRRSYQPRNAWGRVSRGPLTELHVLVVRQDQDDVGTDVASVSLDAGLQPLSGRKRRLR